jgi:ppGpp synthetase/RelA/SpoT-type nucleotidyltranferase
MAKKTKYDYLPNRDIESVITKTGKRIKRKGLLDGAYVRKGYLANGAKIPDGSHIAQEIINQLGGTRRLNIMVGAYDFIAGTDYVSFRIKNPRANYIKIKLNSQDLYDVEVGRVRGDKYTIVKQYKNVYSDLFNVLQEATGMYFRLEHGGLLLQQQANDMVLSSVKEIAHHTEEISEILSMEQDVPLWVLTKLERASTDLSDVTHYLDGVVKFNNGGKIYVSPNVNPRKYEGIMGDYDKDGLPNADDPKPLVATKRAKKSIEQLKFADIFQNLLNRTDVMYEEMNEFVEKLKKQKPADANLYARTKTPYSIINKLIESRLLDEKRGLKDVVGTTLTFDTEQELFDFADKVKNGQLGNVIDYEDMYQQLRGDGYRAIHVIIEQNGIPIELQLKTKRQKAFNEMTHDLYKKKLLNPVEAKRIGEIALSADAGDNDAIKAWDRITRSTNSLKHKLTLK